MGLQIMKNVHLINSLKCDRLLNKGSDSLNYYNQIKEELINNEIYKKSKDYSKNRSDLNTYYNVGRILIEAQGGEEKSEYVNQLIKEYSKKLTREIGQGYSIRNLYNMRLFYIRFKDVEILQALPAKLSWSHFNELLRLKNIDEINYYIKISLEQNLSYRQLHEKIKSKEYDRLDNITKEKLITKQELEINDFIKNPIKIKTNYNIEKINEKILKQSILEDMENFLLELGDGFCFIKSEYKIKIGDRYNYIDLLLFNYKYNCFVVIELKVTESKAEHIGQIMKYMNYIDKNIKTINQQKTVGVILCKRDNKYLMDYCSNPRIFKTVYELN